MVSEERWEVVGSGVWRLLEVMAKVQALERSGGDYSVHCQVLSNLLSSFFSCLSQTTCLLKLGEANPACSVLAQCCLVYPTEGRVDVRAEMSLGRCATLLAGWVGPCGSHGDQECLRVFFLMSLITRALSRV